MLYEKYLGCTMHIYHISRKDRLLFRTKKVAVVSASFDFCINDNLTTDKRSLFSAKLQYLIHRDIKPLSVSDVEYAELK